jgi:SP family general alpha glucoside:H+ symporter-like MFS transporter
LEVSSVSVMMQQLNQKHPDNYLLAMRILWAPIGLMIIFWVFVPESPWFHARRGNKEAGDEDDEAALWRCRGL